MAGKVVAGYPARSNERSKNADPAFKEPVTKREGVPQFFRTSTEYADKIDALVRAQPAGRKTKQALFEDLIDGKNMRLDPYTVIVAALSKAVQSLRKAGLSKDAESLTALLKSVTDGT